MNSMAKISGIAYLSVFICGFYANFAILENLVNFNSSSETLFNIINNLNQFRSGMIGFLIMAISDAVLIWSLFKMTELSHKRLSYIASFFRTLHVVFFIRALINLIKVYSASSEKTISTDLQYSAIEMLRQFDQLWTIGLLFFSLHLFILGYLILKSKYIPRFIGFLIILSAFGYSSDGLSKIFLPSYIDYQIYFETFVICGGVIGELSFTIWLLANGFSRQNPFFNTISYK